MSISKSNIDELQLIKLLITLNGFNISKAAEEMNIQRTNLSAWVNGKQNVFSTSKIDRMLKLIGINAIGDSSTGVRLYLLSNERTHRWQIEEGAHTFIEILRATEETENLKFLEIFEVNTLPKGRFNIVRRKSKSGDLYILISNKDSSANTFPITPETVGFGKIAGRIEVPVEKWVTWLKAKELSASEFRKEISEYMAQSKTVDTVDKSVVQHQLEDSIEKLNTLTVENVGLRAIIRSLLGEIRKLDSGNTMLKKEARDKVFYEAEKKEAEKLKINIDLNFSSDF